ncbi:MAG: transcriptional regulator, TetR family [Solirubrobacterales bacterium]|jgi:AcrR family transcriptional regulator|nr:transcriptional regulator, TetR family [Solirubrobacterales bacterium]
MASSPATRERPRRRLPRAERERQMLGAARRIFAARGFQDASMEEIAAEVGISKPMLYAYFDSKEGLFIACAELASRELVAALEATATTGPPDRRLWRGILTFLEWVDHNREGWRVLYPAGPVRTGPLAAGLAGTRDAMAGTLARLIADTATGEGVAPEAREHIEPLAYTMVAATEAVAEWWLAHPEEPRDLQALRLMNFVWQGFGDLVAGRMWLPPPEES